MATWKVIGDIGFLGKLLDPVKLTMNNGSVLTFLNGAGAIENSFGTTTSFTCCPLTLLNGLVSVDESKGNWGLGFLRLFTGSLSSNTITVGRKTTLNYLPWKKNRNLEVLRGQKDFTYKYHEGAEKSKGLICKLLVGFLGICVFAADLHIRLKKIEFSKNGTVWNPEAGGKDTIIGWLQGFEAIENRLVGILIFFEELVGAFGTFETEIQKLGTNIKDMENSIKSLGDDLKTLEDKQQPPVWITETNILKQLSDKLKEIEKEAIDTKAFLHFTI